VKDKARSLINPRWELKGGCSCRRSNKSAKYEIYASYCGTEKHPGITAYNAVSIGASYVNLTNRRGIISQEN
jgi:hypothetical protein